MTVYKIYCDESRIGKSNYKLMGGIWIREEFGWPFVDEFHDLCIKDIGFLPGHMKWTKLPSDTENIYYQFYLMLIDLYFKYNRQDKMFFKAIIADKNYRYDHKIYNEGDEEVGFYKLYYYLILNTLNPNNRYHVRIAQKNASQKKVFMTQDDRLCVLHKCLNAGFTKKTRYAFWDDVVLTVEPRPAKERRLIQLADILTGAVGYHWNRFHLKAGAKPCKVHLANYISEKICKKDLVFSTGRTNRVFNIFRFQPNK